MKKVKMMLLSLSLVAVVGGALAFKATYTTPFCTAALPENEICDIACPNPVASTSTSNVQFPVVCTANPAPGGGCSGVQCVASTRLKSDL